MRFGAGACSFELLAQLQCLEPLPSATGHLCDLLDDIDFQLRQLLCGPLACCGGLGACGVGSTLGQTPAGAGLGAGRLGALGGVRGQGAVAWGLWPGCLGFLLALRTSALPEVAMTPVLRPHVTGQGGHGSVAHACVWVRTRSHPWGYCRARLSAWLAELPLALS